MIGGGLDDLVLENRPDLHHGPVAIVGRTEVAGRQHEEVAGPAGDGIQHRQQAAASAAAAAHRGEVADLIPQERHGEVVQGREDHASSFAGGARPAGSVEHLDDRFLRLDVPATLLQALIRDGARLAGGVGA